MTPHIVASAFLFNNPDGSLSGLGDAMAWFLGVPFGLALAVGAARVLFGWGGTTRRRR